MVVLFVPACASLWSKEALSDVHLFSLCFKDPLLSTDVLSFQMRSRFEEDPAFQAITEDAERARLFKEYCKALKVEDMFIIINSLNLVLLLQKT